MSLIKLINGEEVLMTSEEEIEFLAEQKLNEQKAVEEKYAQDRKFAYPSIEDQLDMIYHFGLEYWKAEIKKVKDKYPKP